MSYLVFFVDRSQHEIFPLSLEMVKEGEVHLRPSMKSEWKSQLGTRVKAAGWNGGGGGGGGGEALTWTARSTESRRLGILDMSLLSTSSSKYGSGTTASATPESLLDMSNLRSHARLTESEPAF